MENTANIPTIVADQKAILITQTTTNVLALSTKFWLPSDDIPILSVIKGPEEVINNINADEVIKI